MRRTNSRLLQATTLEVTAVLFWGAVVALSLLIVANSVHYYVDVAASVPFFSERPVVTGSVLWRAMFYYHVTGAFVCLLVGPLLLSTWLLRHSVSLHRVVGWAYVIGVVVVSAPAGAYLSLYAKGGVWGQAGFLTLATLWFHSTLAGLAAIRRGDLDAHRSWMTWSYAWASSAISFRLIYYVTPIFGADDSKNYVASLWLSGVVSAVAAILATKPAPIAPRIGRLT